LSQTVITKSSDAIRLTSKVRSSARTHSARLYILSRRIDLFTNLRIDSLDRMALRKEVRDIGQVSE